MVATFHTYSTAGLVNRFAASFIGARRLYAKLSARIAVSEAAQWTAQRYYGGRYRIVPNGVDLSAARPDGARPNDSLRIVFVGRAEERKGLPVLLRAFEALRGVGVPARLTVAGPTQEEVEPLLLDPEGIEIAGQVDDATKWKLLGEADILCAPSLGGESFGMVLTEAFASGTPVVASDIAGYRDVVRNGKDGVLVPVGDAVALGETLLELASDPKRRAEMGEAALESAERFAWPNVAKEIESVYEEALGAPEPDGRVARAAQRLGAVPTEPGPRVGPKRLPSLEPKPEAHRGRKVAHAARRVLITAGAVAGAGLAALALQRIGIESIGRAIVAATPVWVLVAFALMCASMLLRAEAWHAILRAALPGTRVRRRDAARATMIGVLMSASLPARLGEPSRALIVARRVGRVRDRFPIVLGTLVSQTLLNLLALAVLGAVMFHTVGLFKGNEQALIVATIAPVVLLALVVSAPWLLRRGKPSRFQRVQQAATARPWRDAAGALRAPGVPQAQAGRVGAPHAAERVGDPVARLLRAARGARARQPRRDRRGGRGAVRRQRDGSAARHAVEPGRVPGGLRGCPVGLRSGQDERARLRDHPAGGGDRHRRGDGHAGACARGHDLARSAPEDALRGPGPAHAGRQARRSCRS